MPRTAFIIPALDEAARLPPLIDQLLPLPDVEIVVVDGGSRDGTCEIVSAIAQRHAAVRLVHSRAGRGTQMRCGARATDAGILVFLHADSRMDSALPQVWAALPARFESGELEAATFRLQFDSQRWSLRLFALAARIDSALTRFGDQGLVIRRDLYMRCGEFAEVPLFEDVLLLAEVRRRTRLKFLELKVFASARRFEIHGPWRQMLLNIRLFLGWKMGRPIEQLAETYRRGARQR